MSTLDASEALSAVSLLDSGRPGGAVSSPHFYRWVTTSGWTISASSAAGDIAVQNSVPVGGSIDAIVATDANGATAYRLTGLQAHLTDLVWPATGQQAAVKYWQAVLKGDTVIHAPNAAGFAGYGDIYGNAIPGGFVAGNDTFIGGHSLTVAQDFAGDAWSVAGTFTGGNDRISAYGPGHFYGDARSYYSISPSVDGNGTGDMTGGNDLVALRGAVDDSASQTDTVLIGDVDSFGYGTLHGGNDHVVMRDTLDTDLIAGDAANTLSLYTAGTLFGGNDRIEVTNAHVGAVYGDARSVAMTSDGGNDQIRASGSIVAEISGDFGDVDRIFRGGPGQAGGGSDTIIVDHAQASFAVAGDAFAVDGVRGRVWEYPTGYGYEGGIFGGRDLINARDAGQAASLYGDVREGGGIIGGGDDIIFGGAKNDLIVGDVGTIIHDAQLTAGNDRLFGGGGADHIYGDVQTVDASLDIVGGNDRIDGGDGNDVLFGQVGNDTLIGGPGDDRINGGFDDAASGRNTAGFDTVAHLVVVDLAAGTASGQGQDTLIDIQDVIGSSQGDTILGSDSANLLQGRAGNDILGGRDGGDKLLGGDGNDTLSGGSGNDVLQGGAGNDLLDGGAGADALFGGAGHDLFRFDHGGTDRIMDFDPHADHFDLAGAIFSSFQETGGNTVLHYAGGMIEIVGVIGLTLSDWNGLIA